MVSGTSTVVHLQVQPKAEPDPAFCGGFGKIAGGPAPSGPVFLGFCLVFKKLGAYSARCLTQAFCSRHSFGCVLLAVFWHSLSCVWHS